MTCHLKTGDSLAHARYVLQWWLVVSLHLLGLATALVRLALAIGGLSRGQPDEFLAVPLAIILPYTAFIYLARLPGTKTSEGAIMRLAALVLLVALMAIPAFALHLALGFPVAFLVVELFETRFPSNWRKAIKGRLLA